MCRGGLKCCLRKQSFSVKKKKIQVLSILLKAKMNSYVYFIRIFVLRLAQR